MIPVNEKAYVVSVSTIIDVTESCQPVIFRMPSRRPMTALSVGLFKAASKQA